MIIKYSQMAYHGFLFIFTFLFFCMTLFLFSVTGCSCSTSDKSDNQPNGPINVSVSTSRTGGVAPLSVFFDATGTTGLGESDNSFFSDNANYMDATFAWNFDADDNDPDGKYEKASGFIAAHVFEHPGTYRVQLDVYDAAGETASTDLIITVTEFTGNTYYVANGGTDAEGEGSIDHPFATAQYALTGPHVQPNTRILFKKGDTFNTAYFEVNSSHEGPVIVDSYEDLADPSDDMPLIYSTEVNGQFSTCTIYADDWRIMNIAVRSGGSSYENDGTRYPTGIIFSGNNNLKFRTIEYELGQSSFSLGGQYNTIAECECYNVHLGAYSSSADHINDGNALIGNYLHDQTGDRGHHTFRLQGGSRLFIAYNQFGPGLESIDYDALTIRGNSEKVVVLGNTLYGWVQTIQPQNRNSAREYQHHCIMDSNLIIGQNLYDGGDRLSAIAISARDIVIRNNIFYDYQFGVVINNDTVVGPSTRIKIYNNTFINPTANDTFYIVNAHPACTDIEITNNLMFDAAGGEPYFLGISGPGDNTFRGVSDRNLCYGSSWGTDPQIFNGITLALWQSTTGNDLHSSIADPLLLSTDPANPDFCKAGADSPVINTGEYTSAALDYYGNLRDSSRDIGACEYFE